MSPIAIAKGEISRRDDAIHLARRPEPFGDPRYDPRPSRVDDHAAAMASSKVF